MCGARPPAHPGQLAYHLPDHDRVVGRVLVAEHPETNWLMVEDRRLRVLVVEDNPLNQAVAVAILAKLGYRADVAGNGREAVEAVTHAAYGAVLMDYQLPELNGAQATAAIRALDPHARIIILSVYKGEEDVHRAVQAGASGYLPKSAEPRELVEAIRAIHNGGQYFPAAA